MKFCPNCGEKLNNPNFKFCHQCGYKFGSDTNNSNQSKQSEPKEEKAYRDRKNKDPNSYESKSKHYHSSKTCTVCGGTGQIRVINRTFLGELVNVKTCKECGGTGEIITEFSDENYGKFSNRKYKKTKTQGKKRGLFSRKSPELKKFEKELTYYLGGGSISDEYYIKRQNELNGFKAPSGNVKTILVDEFENGNLSMDNLTNRIDELICLDNLSLVVYMLRKGYDTSVIKTQDDLYEFLKENYDNVTADKSNLKIKIHTSGIWGFRNFPYFQDILMKELEDGNLSLDDADNRIEELKGLDISAMNLKVLDKGHDTSVIKTQEDLYEFLKENYGMQVAEDSNKKRYHKEELFKKYNIDPNEAYCFECTIEERGLSTFTNTDRINVDSAYVALYDDYLIIIKESVWLKSDMGMRKVYFNNVTSIDYDTAGKLGMTSCLFIHMHSGEHVQLKFITKEIVDEVHKRYENFINKNSSNNNVTITQETSNADELLKYAELYKQGLLTEEEFEAKKKELL